MCALAGTLSVLLTALAAGEARAGAFQVGSCESDRIHSSAETFRGFSTRGMAATKGCKNTDRGLTGLVTRTRLSPGRVGRGARAILTMTAPPGTRFSTFTWGGGLHRADCGYALQVYADAPDRQPTAIENLRANQKCPRPGRAQASGLHTITRNVGGATRIVQRIICAGSSGRRSCSTRHNNYVRTQIATATVVDDTPPSVAIAPDTPLAQGAWVNGTQALNYDATDNVGVRSARAILGGQGQPFAGRSCNYADSDGTFAGLVPCDNGRAQINVNTREIPEGTQPLVVQANDTAGNQGASAPVIARVDNTAPGRVDVGVVGGEQWRNTNDFALAWTNPPEGDRAPIVAATSKLCAAGTTNCATTQPSGPGISSFPISVPAAGEWTVSMWRHDAAGNADEHAASVPVTLRYDPEPPAVGFEPISLANPTQIGVQVTDKVSGLAGGTIEISRQGTGIWQTLDTRKDGTRLLAQIDDSALPAGAYALRTRAYDQAHNETSTDRRLDGQPMLLTLPLRLGTNLQAGIATTKTIRRRVGRRGHRRWVHRQVTELTSAARGHIGQRLPIAGRLTANGQGIAGAPVQVLAASPISGESLVATLQTDAGGNYRYPVTAASTSTLRFSYAGSAVLLPAQGQVGVVVAAASSLGVRPARVLNGQAVSFRGRLATLPAPAGGKLVELQAFVSRRWQTFRTVRSDQAGRWAVGYRFQRTRGTQRYRFRARIPDETGYPFATGASSTVSVQVRGR